MGVLIGLAGNQNSGKTTLFNQLTGSNQHVGNFPGVTVERKEGYIKKHKDAVLVDLPGVYSLSPYSSEEVVTRDFLVKDRPDVIINIVDATNIERNLYLTLQLMELGIPMVIALNMMDEVRKSGNTIDALNLEKTLGVPVVPISASKSEGTQELIENVLRLAHEKTPPKKLDFCAGAVHKAIHSVAHIVEDKAKKAGYSPRFASTKLIEGDDIMERELNLSENERDIIGHVVSEMEGSLGTDREAALADMRYSFIEDLCRSNVKKSQETNEYKRSVRIDAFLAHRVFAIPIFILIMLCIFWLTFEAIGPFFQDLLSAGIDSLTNLVSNALKEANVSAWMQSLIVDGIFAGVGSVLTFLPVIVLLFFFLSLLEDTGYMARVAFVMDKLLRKIGLSGRSFVPMLIGFGCSVPAIMATRTLASRRDRRLTIILTPFMSCSAKLPIYALFTAAFFPEYRALVMIALYLTGFLVAVLSGLILKNTVFQGKPVPFVMELPAYRMPSVKSGVIMMWEKSKDFLQRAFTVIFIATIVIWFLQNLDFSFNMVADSSESMLARLGSLIAPVFAPMGFGDWRAATAIMTGLLAKETVVSTFAVTFKVSKDVLPSVLSTMYTPLSAFSMSCFCLLYMPCVAALAAARRELGTVKAAVFAASYQTGVAWLVAFIVYQAGLLLGLG